VPSRPFLLRILRVITFADTDPVRQTLFANLKESHRAVRVVFALHERIAGTMASALLVSIYGLEPLLTVAAPRNRRARVITVARHANARRQIDRVTGWLSPGESAAVETPASEAVRRLVPTAASLLASPRSVVRVLRILRRLDRRHGFLVACRAAAAFAWYSRSLAILRARRPAAILVSSDSNPEELGFVAAARALGIPTVFTSHAYPTPFSPPLDFNLSLLIGEAEIETRRRQAPIAGAVLAIGLDGASRPLDLSRFERPSPVIGIFTPKAISWGMLAQTIDDCRRHYRARQVVIRWHPSMIETPQLARHLADLTGVVESPRTAQLVDVAQQCDWVIADENSNVHLAVLKIGIPSIAVKQLGRYPGVRSDMYGFVRNHIVPRAVASVADLRADDLATFFGDHWTSRFHHYDASYGQPAGVIEAAARDALRRVGRTESQARNG